VTQGRGSGVLPVEKGAGVTSYQVVAHLRRLLRARKIGHGGTLDPDATGVLPVLIGAATKLMPYLVGFDKEYVATVRLGMVTDTQDTSGRVLATHPVPALDEDAVRAVLGRFVGRITQVPPMYSALHHGGRRLHELARAGVEVERAPREVTVHAIALEALVLPHLTLRVTCGKGTYVRTLAADLGAALGCGGTLAALVRSRAGPFRLEAAVPWTELAAARDGAVLWQRVLPLDAALAGLPAVVLDPGRERRFLNGQAVADPAGADGLVRVYGAAQRFLGVGLCRGAAVKPERLVHADPARSRSLPA
jgi:tRNA pseudouridine55 synthase